MQSQSAALDDGLPRSHYFVTISRGSNMRTVAIRAIVVQCAMLVLPILALIGCGSTLYLGFHDDLVAEVMRRQSVMQYAYEDRIEGLRQDLERQTERGRADEARLDGRLHDIVAREAKLESHAGIVAELAGESVGSVGSDHRPALPPAITGDASNPAPSALGYAPSDKPRPLSEAPARGPAALGGLEDHASLLDDPNLPIADRLSALSASLDGVEGRQAQALYQVGSLAKRRIGRIRDLFEDAGLSPERYLTRTAASNGVGGLYVPLPAGPDGDFDRTVADLRGTVSAAAQLNAALGRVPLAAPVSGRQDVTSPFGARLDPFLGRPALHTGVDLREPYGADIRATGGGRVVSAGAAGGYGNMVEIDHGNGISTRYAHMAEIIVSPGQMVSRGTVVGRAGATGRATGPHLHYEVRVDGEPVDPMRFLAAAPGLAAVEAR